MGCPTLWKKSRNWHCHYVFFIFCMGNRWFWCQQRHLAQGCKLWSNLYKMLWSSIQCWTMVVFKKLQGFDHEIGSQISFPNFMFRQKFLYWSVAWRYRNEKNISTRYKDSKESTIQAEHFFKDYHGITGVQSPTCTPDWNFINGVDNPEIVYTF